MKKTSWRIRLLLFVATKIAKSQFTVNFTPPESENMHGVGFTWDPETARKMVARFSESVLPQNLTRSQRRALNRAAERAAKK